MVRFDLPRLGDIAIARRTPAMPYRHRHPVAGAPGRAGQRPGLLPASLAQARRLAERCGAAIDYVEASVYDAASVLPADSFDLVYTGIGALNWLPRIDGWARNVAALLQARRPPVPARGHPLLFALDGTARTGW